jgi:hypothetical protein
MGNRVYLEMLLLCHRWLVSLSRIYSRRRSDCQQDLHDTGRRRKYSVASLPRKTASQDPMLLKIRGNAQTLDSLATALAQILGCPDSSMIHCIIQQCQNNVGVHVYNRVATSTQMGMLPIKL